MLPYSRQSIDKDDINAFIRVLQSDRITQGPAIEQFEKQLAAYCNAQYAVLFSHGTAALHGAYFAAGIKSGDEIITSPLTFAATANAALWQGAEVIFADIDAATGNIDPKDVEQKITKKTKAIVAIDYAGHPANLAELNRIAQLKNLILIEDAAHSLGATYEQNPVGGIADMTMFSFHPVKSITTGEGGAITTNNKQYYEKLILFRNHGITKKSEQFQNDADGPWYYEMQELGLNYRITDMQAALGISQLKKINTFIAQRKKIAEQYAEKLSHLSSLALPKERPNVQSSWHLYPIRLKGDYQEKRKALFNQLQKAGIGVQVHYIPVYWHPYYQKRGYKKGICPQAEDFYRSAISIPLFPDLSAKDQQYVITILSEIVGRW